MLLTMLKENICSYNNLGILHVPQCQPLISHITRQLSQKNNKTVFELRELGVHLLNYRNNSQISRYSKH